MCSLSCFAKFCSTKYNTPRTFCLASYSVVFHDSCWVSAFAYHHKPFKLPATLGCDSSDYSDYLFSYQLPSWFVMRSAPPVTLHRLTFPLRASKPMFFPLHLLHCYHHRSYPWWDPHESEQACVEWPIARRCYVSITSLGVSLHLSHNTDFRQCHELRLVKSYFILTLKITK